MRRLAVDLAAVAVLAVAAELGLEEAEAGVLQVMDPEEVGAEDDLVDVVSAQDQLGSVGKL